MSQLCAVCGAPRTTTDAACPFCRTLFATVPAGAGAPVDVSPPTGEASLPPALVAALDAGDLVDAIKIYRNTYKSSLKEAKEACDSLADARGKRAR